MEVGKIDDVLTKKGVIPSKQLPHLLFALACVVILTLFVTGYYQSSASVKSLTTLREYSRQQDSVDNLLIDLLNVETGVRGYLITGKIEYLKNYASSVETLDLYLSKVSESLAEVSHMKDEISHMSDLIVRYKSVFQELIENKSQSGRVDSLDIYHGKIIFDEMRTQLSEIKGYLTFDSAMFYRQAARSQEYTRWAIFALCTAAFGFLIWLFSTQQQQVELRRTIVDMLTRENEFLDKEVAKRTSQLTRLASQLTRLSEVEKQRLARELHDDMGASLTAAKMDAAWIAEEQSESGSPTLKNRIQRLIGSLDDAITLKRRLTTDLLPPLLNQLGLFEALRSLADDLGSFKAMKVAVDVPDVQPELDHEISLAIFRIAQEAMTNVRKYSQASAVSLCANMEKGNLVLEVKDDGIGFTPESVKEECFGLVSMRHRAQMIAASLKVESAPGKGTKVRVTCPQQAVIG